MTHVNDDDLLLLAYGELAEAAAREAETHLASCSDCRSRLERLERAAGVAAWAAAAPRPQKRPLRWTLVAGLAAAAVLAAVLITRPKQGTLESRSWPLPAVWSATAGYVAGGTTIVEIDAQLTRLEQERYYGFPD